MILTEMKQMNSQIKESILKEIDPTKVSKSFCMYVVGKLPHEKIVGYLEEYRNHFINFIERKMEKEQIPDEVKYDTDTIQHKEKEIARDLEQQSQTQMRQLEMWLDQFKLNKTDWKQIWKEIV